MQMYWNPKFFQGLTQKKFFGLLKHECYHLIYNHLTSRKQTPHLMWNIATDLAINSTIPISELPDGGIIPGYKVSYHEPEDGLKNTLSRKASEFSDFIASLPPNKDSEWYMAKLQDNNMEDTIEELFGNKGQPSPGSSDSEGVEGKGTCAGFDFHFDNDVSETDKSLAEAKIKKIVKDSIQKANNSNCWGSVSSEMRSKLSKLVNDSVDWKDVLRYFCGTKQKANKTRTMRKINRKYPYIHAGRKIKHTSNLAIYIDQSGSVSDDAITMFFGALNNLSKNVTFTVYHFDTSVDENSKYVWKKNQPFKSPYRTRSGGTCFDVVEDHFRKYSALYDGYIIMSDGEAPKPKSCKSKRCWVLLPGSHLYFNADNRDVVIKMK